MADLAPAHVDDVASTGQRLEILRAIESKVLWLATWTIHHANHLRAKPRRPEGRRTPGLVRVGRDADDGAVFRRAAPAGPGRGQAARQPGLPCHPDLLGRQTGEKLERFRALRRRAILPVADQGRRRRRFLDRLGRPGRRDDRSSPRLPRTTCALHACATRPARGPHGGDLGDAELDEGNVFEALLEGWKHDVRNVWWVIDYNRQSLDAGRAPTGCSRIDRASSRNIGWHVVTLKYGGRSQAAFARRGRRGLARLDRRLPELPLRAPWLQGRRRLARAAGERSRPATRASATLLDDARRRPRCTR